MVRRQLVTIYRAALAAVHGRRVVRAALERNPSLLRHVVAIGKAAGAMLGGVFDACGTGVQRALLVTRHGYADPADGFDPTRTRVIEAGHPEPDAASLAAGQALLEFIDATPGNDGILFLISGGASALVEVLSPGMTLAQLAQLTRTLLANGDDIARINAARKATSQIKGGKLAHYLKGRPARVLVISDVPGDDFSVIGSGLLFSSPAQPNIQHELVATNADVRRAAADAACVSGYDVQVHDTVVTGDVNAVAPTLVDALKNAPGRLHIWGGECTVCLPPHPGIGGRNQHLALAVALALSRQPGAWLLCGATDGSDGGTDDAGALVDAGTRDRITAAGLDAAHSLARADSGTALRAAGDVLHTCPTGTNVMDLIIGVYSPARVR